MKAVTLVIFTSEGREHLLKQMFASFSLKNDFKFYELILAIDGNYDLSAIQSINADVQLRQIVRSGYINNIRSAINIIDTPYMFWLEDDFIFNEKIPVKTMLETIMQENWAGVYLSRQSKLEAIGSYEIYDNEIVIPAFGFSVSPSLCRVEYLKKAFEELYNTPKSHGTKDLGFEPFIDSYFVKSGLKYGMLRPEIYGYVDHIGELESTDRKFHMINSVDENTKNTDYMTGFHRGIELTLYNKLTMLPKLFIAIFVLSIRLFWDRRAYDFAFRVYLSFLRKFKY